MTGQDWCAGPPTASRLPGFAGLPARRRAAPRRRPAAAAGVLGPLVLLAFLMSLVVPGTLGLGPVNLTAYRLVLIAACIPLGLRWISGRAGPVTAVDLLFFASCVWISIALVMVHGLSRIVFVGTNFIELFGAYLVGRVLVRDAAGHRRFVRAMLLLVVVLFPFALLEFLTGTKLLQTVFGVVMSMKETSLPQQRLGFTRAAASFSHPIHFGLFATLVFANVYFLFWRSRAIWRLGATGFVAFTAMLAISSAALFSLVLQTAMIVWDRGLAFLKSRWVIGIALGAGLLVFLLVSVQGGLFTYIVENLIFAQGAGEHRLDIYYYGMLEVLRHPLFGVGLNEWARPFWRPHPTIDSFWLMTAVRHGIPGILLLMIGIVRGMLRISTARGLDEDGRPLPLGLPDRALRPDPHLEHRAHLGAGHRLRDGLSRRRRLVLHRRPPGGARRSRPPAARARGRAPGRSGRRAAAARRRRAGSRKRLCGRNPWAMRRSLVAGMVVQQWQAGRPDAAAAARGGRQPVRGPGNEYDVRDLPEAPRPADPVRAPPRLPARRADRARGPGADDRHRLDPAVPRGAREPRGDRDQRPAQRALRRPRLREPAPLPGVPRRRASSAWSSSACCSGPSPTTRSTASSSCAATRSRAGCSPATSASPTAGS